MQKRPRPRRRKTSAERTQILLARAQSNLCDREFAAQHGLSASSLYRWQRERSTGQRVEQASLIEIPNLLSSQPAVPGYRLRFPSGLLLEVAPGFEPEELRALAQLIQAL